MEWTENKLKWNSFLSPLRSPRKVTWGGSSRMQIKKKLPGTQYLSQTFANRLLENTEKPIPVKGRSEELRKVTKNFQQNEVLKLYDKAGSGTSFPKGQLSSIHSQDSRGASLDGTDSGSLSKRPNAVKKGDTDNQDQQRTLSTGASIFSPTGQINIELLDNSIENPIAISDDESIEENIDETFSPPKKRKQDNVIALDITELSPRKHIDTEKHDLCSVPAIKDVDLDLKNETQGRAQDSGVSIETKKISGDLEQERFVLETGKPGSQRKWEEKNNKFKKDSWESLSGKVYNEEVISTGFNKNESLNLKTDNVLLGNGISNMKSTSNANGEIKRSPIVFPQQHLSSPDQESDEIDILADINPQHLASLEKEHSIERPRIRAERTPNKKDDIDKPCSQWNLDLFSRYFDFESSVEELDLQQNLCENELQVDQMISEFKRRIHIASSTVKFFGHEKEETLTCNFESLCRTEVGTRLILNEIFFPLCSCLNLSVEIERNVDCSYLPNCKFDYRIVNSNGEVIGAVEAKSSRSLKPDSVVQAVLELCILQTERLTRKTNNKNMPLFNILTDGVRYVFIVLQGDKLQFEQRFNKIRVREMTTWDSVKNLYKSLLHLMRLQEHVVIDKKRILIDSRRCYQCHEVNNPADCTTSVNCGVGKECIVSETIGDDFTYHFNVGCVEKSVCTSGSDLPHPSSGPDIVGKRTVMKRNLEFACCDSDLCNNKMPSEFQPTSCPSGTHEFRDGLVHLCYFILKQDRNADDGARACATQFKGGKLAYIPSDAADNFIKLTLKGDFSGDHSGAFIGVFDKQQELSFVDTDGAPQKFFDWRHGQPNDPNVNDPHREPAQDCVRMFPIDGEHFSWQDKPCEQLAWTLCSINIHK
ncbi:uncharacterized protein LOC134255978 [Saccostrea cucullata]|uniref:uncharacterized protein LOC134255978 n=1 Tax=Saccostrea cuccullata TaxID=36930 RepID=UPI002ED49C47